MTPAKSILSSNVKEAGFKSEAGNVEVPVAPNHLRFAAQKLKRPKSNNIYGG